MKFQYILYWHFDKYIIQFLETASRDNLDTSPVERTINISAELIQLLTYGSDIEKWYFKQKKIYFIF